MKITKKGEYALKSLLALALAHPQKSLSLREISSQEGLPVKFLEQIMMILKRTGFVNSTQGKRGGYTLSRPPQKIILGDVIRAVDGPLAPIETAAEIKKKILKEERHPGFYWTLLEVRDAIADILDRRTLADVCEKSAELNRKKAATPMYYI